MSAQDAVALTKQLLRFDTVNPPGQERDCAPVRDAGRDVGPLARVGALGEEAAKGVERCRRLAQDPVRVLVDEGNGR